MAGFTLGSIGRGLAAAAFALAAAAAQAQDKVTLTTTWFAQAEHGGFYQAVATGIYKKYGLDVTVRMGGPQVNGVQLLLAGQSDFVINYDFAKYGTSSERRRLLERWEKDVNAAAK